MNLSTNFDGLNFHNPLLPASGPLTGDLEKMEFLVAAGVGGMVTKTISIKAAVVPRPCIYGENGLIMNTELWSEYPAQKWIDEILPAIKKDLQIPMIISLGYTAEDMETLVPAVDKFADAYEISTHYVGKDLSNIAKTVRTIRANTKKPFYMKMSPHIPEPVEFAKMVKENGANGIVAINSLGPTMKINLPKRSVFIGGKQGFSWSSGPAIKNLSLALVHTIRESDKDITIIGTGGVKTADDIIEFLLAGANAVQMLSSALIYGKDLYEKIINELPEALARNGFESVDEVRNTGLTKHENVYSPTFPTADPSKCKLCGLCEKICPYFAAKVDTKVSFNGKKCFGCGLCQSRCPHKAIYGVL